MRTRASDVGERGLLQASLFFNPFLQAINVEAGLKLSQSLS